MFNVDARFGEIHNPHADYEYPTYVDCARCGIRKTGPAEYCSACKSIRTRQPMRSCGYVIPRFDINLYSRTPKDRGLNNTAHAFRNAHIAYWRHNLYDDAITHDYLIDLCGHMPRTVVTISTPGQLLAHWEDDDPAMAEPWIQRAIREALELAA